MHMIFFLIPFFSSMMKFDIKLLGISDIGHDNTHGVDPICGPMCWINSVLSFALGQGSLMSFIIFFEICLAEFICS